MWIIRGIRAHKDNKVCSNQSQIPLGEGVDLGPVLQKQRDHLPVALEASLVGPFKED